MRNQQISTAELAAIRALNDFDLKMLISEIHDHGWPMAKKLIPLMNAATEVHGDRREQEVQ